MRSCSITLGLAASLLCFGYGLRTSSKGAKSPSYKQTLHNFQNVQYYADFQIGGQTMAGIFDTGSFELLVRSTRCAHCAHPTPAYDRLKSTTYVENGTVTKHVFGSGPCITMMGYDSVSVGDMVSPDQAFWEITDHRISVMDTAKFAAIVGIGPNFGFGNKEKTLLMSYGVDEFSICLQKESGSDGYLVWGPYDTQLRNDDYAVATVVGKHHWAAQMTAIGFGEKYEQAKEANNTKDVMVCGDEQGCVAIIDSGTSLIAAPGIALMQLSEQLPPIQEDCSNLHELPTLHFVLNGTDFALPPEAYVMRVTGAHLEADDIWDILFFKPKIRKLDMCMPAFMQIDMMSQNGPVWIMGMPFFRYYHTTFDRTHEVMKFAVASDSCEPQKFHPITKTESLLATSSGTKVGIMDMDIDALVPPTLSGQMDYPFDNAGEIDL